MIMILKIPSQRYISREQFICSHWQLRYSGPNSKSSKMGMTSLFLILSLSVLASFAAEAPVTKDAKSDLLYNDILVGDYSSAIDMSRKFENEHNGEIIREVVNKLLSESKRNTVEYAYQLWNNNLRDLVREYFPIQLRVLVGSNTIKIINKRDGLALKLANSEDSYGDRKAYGDGHDTSSQKISWTTFPMWNDNKVYFRIVNNHRNQTLKLGTSGDSIGDHTAYGAYANDTNRHLWYLHPVYSDSDLLFYIINREFEQGLKLGRDVDSHGDRILYSNNGNVFGQPEIYGWIIEPY